MIVISHNLADVFEVADRIFVLRLGREAGDFDARRGHTARTWWRAITGATGERRRQDGGRMSTGASETAPPAGEPVEVTGRAGTVLRRFLQGDLGELRVLLAWPLIWAIFQVQEDRFLTATNLTNLVLQITAVGLISIGVVLVLLLGEIDLSVGAVSGLCAGDHGRAERQARLGALPGDRRGRARGHRDRALPGLHVRRGSASPRSWSRWPGCWPGRGSSSRCWARPAR